MDLPPHIQAQMKRCQRDYVVLSGGVKMPLICFGTRMVTNKKTLSAQNVQDNVVNAIKVGFRAFDCAPSYDTERQVGFAVEDAIKNHNLKRKEFFIITKLEPTCFGAENVVPSLRRSLEKLKMDYVDMFVLHLPFSTNGVSYLDTWKGMEECVRLKLARSIGVSNFNIYQIATLIKTHKIKPSINQIEMHVHLHEPNTIAYCKSESIQVMGYRPIYTKVFESKPKETKFVDLPRNLLLEWIAMKHRKTEAQIRLRFQLDNRVVPIVSSSNPEHMQQNMRVLKFKLDEEELTALKEIDRNFRTNALPLCRWYKDYPFSYRF